MDRAGIKLTERASRIIKNAENEAATDKLLEPGHLLIACLFEKTGAIPEAVMKSGISVELVRKKVNENTADIKNRVKSSFTVMPVRKEAEDVFRLASHYMERYNQTFLNEGHLLRALLEEGTAKDFLTEKQARLLLQLGTSARDLITHLAGMTFSDKISNYVRKVKSDDKADLLTFIEDNFSKGWAKTIEGGFRQRNPGIYISEDTKGNITGFAAFDIYKQRKGYFGPMGVAKNNRTKGTGAVLLHSCLQDMHKMGYEYAVLGGAGPIEFYEKTCCAVVIPSAEKFN